MYPNDIKVNEDELIIEWDNFEKTTLPIISLRSYCPCAICSLVSDQKGSDHFRVLNGDELIISDISIVGRYAINVVWKDGHNTGIYEFEYLKSIGENVT